ncbi:S8 family serine peptidase [Mycoplasmopsis cynos]|uniref:S8 family serine peptidase n=1 Tax=Mycoplasmopsis cynos TaxID=171284 RepID=UPI0024CDAE1D|nr:S8 family serine peptidase [Mycoplasmopsis cynos]WAM08855.1 S8 family serine peptidase [Mycoplasmopsis cynos]
MHDKWNINIFNNSASYFANPLDCYYLYQKRKEFNNIAKNILNWFDKKFGSNNVQDAEKWKSNLSMFVLFAKLFVYYYLNNDSMFENEGKKIEKYIEELDQYVGENDIKFIASAGNGNEEINWYNRNYDNSTIKQILKTTNKNNIITKISEMIGNIDINKPDESKELSNTILKNNKYEILNNIKGLVFFKFFLEKNWNSYNSDKKSEFWDDEKRYPGVFDGYKKWISHKKVKNIIYVGAMNSNNIPTNFTAFSDQTNDNHPFISAFGENRSVQSQLYPHYKTQKLLNEYKNKFKNEQNLSRKDLESHYKEKEKEFMGIAIAETRESLYRNLSTNFYSSNYLTFKDYIDYFNSFAGTSMSAPMITGILSLMQNKIKRELTLNEAKILLASSAIYSSTTTSKHINFKPEYIIENTSEFWKNNKTKSKTGYGIPKFFEMKKFIMNKVISYSDFKNDNKSEELLSKSYKHNISHNFNNLTGTFSYTIKKTFDSYLDSIIPGSNDEKIIKKLIKEYNAKNKNDYNKNFFDVALTIEMNCERFDKEGELIKYKTERTKFSNSFSSNVERTHFENYTHFVNGEYYYTIIYNECLKYWDVLSDYYDKKLKKHGEDSTKKEQFISKLWHLYNNYLKKYVNYNAIITIN